MDKQEKNHKYKRVVIKVGSSVVTEDKGKLDIRTVASLVSQIADLMQDGCEVLLVSSGAVAAGLKIYGNIKTSDAVERRQVLAALGQVKLINTYAELFANFDINVAQVLASKVDFAEREHYLNMRRAFNAILKENIIPIVNENDPVAVTEKMFTDNDELASLIAAMLNADALIILSNIDGLFTGHPDEPSSKLITEVSVENTDFKKYISKDKSSVGRGGMETKFRMALKLANLGIETYLANGKAGGNIKKIYAGENIGTKFIAVKKKPNLKRWLAYSSQQDSMIHIDLGAFNALVQQNNVISLLPVGIEKIVGDFVKGDIIKIVHAGKEVGWGIAEYDSETAKAILGKRGEKPLIHYDYLYINY